MYFHNLFLPFQHLVLLPVFEEFCLQNEIKRAITENVVMVTVMHNFLSTRFVEIEFVRIWRRKYLFLSKQALPLRFVELVMVLILIYNFPVSLPTSVEVTTVFCAFTMNELIRRCLGLGCFLNIRIRRLLGLLGRRISSRADDISH